jgi:ribulose 1,5-bisphosphate carboxylase large subunit-like protein
MGKKKNNKGRLQDQKISELVDQVNSLSWLLRIIMDLITGLQDQTHKDIAALDFKDEQQYGVEMLQLTTMKRLLGIIQMSINTAVNNLLGGEKNS